MSSPLQPPGPTLSLDTSASRVSVALRAADGSREVVEGAEGERAGTVLHRLLAELLERAGVELGALSRVAAVRGPGSFTGLRVGLAAAQGLCMAEGLRGVGVDTTAAIAWSSGHSGRLAVLLDGGQGRYFAARHRRDGDRLEELSPVEDLDPQEALAWLEREPVEACLLRRERGQHDALLAAGAELFAGALAPAAAELAALGLAAAPLEPLYARAPAIRPRQP